MAKYLYKFDSSQKFYHHLLPSPNSIQITRWSAWYFSTEMHLKTFPCLVPYFMILNLLYHGWHYYIQRKQEHLQSTERKIPHFNYLQHLTLRQTEGVNQFFQSYI
jgi:hypothetical protein